MPRTFAPLAALFLLAGTGTAAATEEPLSVVEPVPVTPIEDGFTLAAVGDIIYLRPMLATIEKQSPRMLTILRAADVTFGNFETTALDLQSFKGAPQAESGGTWMLADPGVVDDVRAMGFDIVSFANNHTTDWGVEGMLETSRRLRDGGLISAGTGTSLAAATAPRYLDVPAGRVALVAATSTFTPMSRAADALGEVPARPGANALRTEEVGLLDASDLAVIARISDTEPGAPVILNEKRYEARSDGDPSKLRYIMNSADAAKNLRAIRQGKQNGNFVIFSLHNHEPDNDSELPADFAVQLAHEAIDNGADAFIGHGPHRLRGIEIYKGKPIFYSLGNFAMMNNSLDVIPRDMYDEYGLVPGNATTSEILQARNAEVFADPDLFESVIAVSRYVAGNIAEIRLYPIDLGVDARGAARGVPKSPDRALSLRVLQRLQRLSRPYGTRIDIVRGIGLIRVDGNRRDGVPKSAGAGMPTGKADADD